MKIIELFGGIGAPRKALERIGIKVDSIDYVEIDKYAVKSYNEIYGENYEPQNICSWDKNIECDMIFHGSPCQDFSVAGNGKGGDIGSGTRSSLMYETIRIVGKIRPKYVIWENVKNVISKKHKHNFDNYLNTMAALGYKNYWKVLNAKDYGVPQNRERVFTVSILNGKEFEFPEKKELRLKLKDILEKEVDEKYYLSDKMLTYVLDLNDVQKGTKWEDRANNGSMNKDIALTIGVRSAEAQRGGVTNFVVDGVEEEIKVKYVKEKYKEFVNKNGYVPEMFNPYNKSEIKEIAPTQSTSCGSTTSSATVLVKEATKQGYKEAYEGDSINLEQPNSLTRRGRVGNQVAQTLTCSCNQATITDLRIRKLTPLECWRLMRI